MRFYDLLATAATSLWQRKFRSFLTVLGVLIGTTAVVVMVSVGLGMAKAQFDSIERYTNVRQITIDGPPMDSTTSTKPKRMDDAMLAELKAVAPNAKVYPIYRVEAAAKVKGYEGWLSIQGMPKDALADQNFDIASGGTITPGSSKLQLVVGHMIADSFWSSQGPFVPDSGSMVGETLKLDFSAGSMPGELPGGSPGSDGSDDTSQKTPVKKMNATVVGQLAGTPGEYNSTALLVVADMDALVKTLKKVYPGKALPGQEATSEGKPKGTFLYTQFIIETETLEEAKETYQVIKDLKYSAYAPVEWMDQMQQQTQLTLAVFGGIGAISLLVAAIGIANTMMMSVYERTREIGVMKVLGAALGDIRSLFLLEAAGIGFIGGVLGVAVSYPLSGAVSQWVMSSLGDSGGGGIMGMPMESTQSFTQMPLWLVGTAIVFATLIGTLAGVMPAQRAMKLSALDAIRTQ